MRRQQLDGLRLLAFLLIFFFHIGSSGLGPPLNYGRFGTDVFFVLSGFLITRMLTMNIGNSIWQELRTFYIRRSLRIFPVYYLFLTILLLLHQLPEALYYYLYIANWKLYAGTFPGAHWHLWTLCIEEQYYLIFPLIFLWTPVRWRFFVVALLALAFESCNLMLLNTPGWYLLPFTRSALLWGSLAGMLDVKYADKNLKGGLMFGLGILISAVFFYTDLTGIQVPYPVQLQAFVLVIWGLWRTKNKILLAPFTFAPIAYLGKISYGLYLFHATTMSLWFFLSREHPMIKSLNPSLTILIMTIIQAMISWHLFEKPINDLKDKFKFRPAEKQGSMPPLPSS